MCPASPRRRSPRLASRTRLPKRWKRRLGSEESSRRVAGSGRVGSSGTGGAHSPWRARLPRRLGRFPSSPPSRGRRAVTRRRPRLRRKRLGLRRHVRTLLVSKTTTTGRQLVAHRAQSRQHPPVHPRCGACGKHFPKGTPFANTSTDSFRISDLQGPIRRRRVRRQKRRRAGCTLSPLTLWSGPGLKSDPVSEATGVARPPRARLFRLVGTEPDGRLDAARACASSTIPAFSSSPPTSPPPRPSPSLPTSLTSCSSITCRSALDRRRARASSPSSTTDGPSSSATISRTTSSASASTIPRAAAATPRDTPRSSDTPENRSLRTLAAELLGEVIQAEGAAHDPREDAMAAMRSVPRRAATVPPASPGRRGGDVSRGDATRRRIGARRRRRESAVSMLARRRATGEPRALRHPSPRRATVDASAKTVRDRVSRRRRCATRRTPRSVAIGAEASPRGETTVARLRSREVATWGKGAKPSAGGRAARPRRGEDALELDVDGAHLRVEVRRHGRHRARWDLPRGGECCYSFARAANSERLFFF